MVLAVAHPPLGVSLFLPGARSWSEASEILGPKILFARSKMRSVAVLFLSCLRFGG